MSFFLGVCFFFEGTGGGCALQSLLLLSFISPSGTYIGVLGDLCHVNTLQMVGLEPFASFFSVSSKSSSKPCAFRTFRSYARWGNNAMKPLGSSTVLSWHLILLSQTSDRTFVTLADRKLIVSMVWGYRFSLIWTSR